MAMHLLMFFVLSHPSSQPVFLLSLCKELASPDKNPNSRRLAGLILKNALDAKDEARKQQRIQQWLSLDANTKTHIKSGVSGQLLLFVCLVHQLASTPTRLYKPFLMGSKMRATPRPR